MSKGTIATNNLIQPSLQQSKELLEIILGIHISPEYAPQALLQVSLLGKYLNQLPRSIRHTLATTTTEEVWLDPLLLDAMKALSSLLSSGTSTSFTSLVDGLTTRGLVVASSEDDENVEIASLNLVVTLLGCMTLLYPDARHVLSTASVWEGEKPIVDFLCGMGSLMSSLPSEASKSSRVELYVSNLNARTLIEISDITIVWTTRLGHHLRFDHSTQELSLFCLPSFCQLHTPTQSENATVPLVTRYLMQMK
jgi:hypothetical protein